jgi:Uma2 family endonuclease
MRPKTYDVKFTYEDYLLFPDDGRRHELIDGEHFMTPSPSTRHQRISRNLLTLLHNYLRQAKAGEAFDAPTDVLLSDMDVVQPDLLFISSHRSSIITERCIHGAPDLVVEIVSETTRKTDEVIKRKLYERYGVQEYWIVDPELEIIKVFRMTEQGYVRSAELSNEAKDALTTPLLPDLQIPLREIFE